MMKSARFLLLLFALSLSAALFAQGEDCAASWTSLSIKKNFEHGLGLTFREELRTKDNISAIDVFFIRLTGTYKPCPYFSTSLAYDFFGAPQKTSMKSGLQLASYLKSSHRALFDLNGMASAGQWSFSLRERYVFAYTMPAEVSAADSLGMAVTASLPSSTAHLLRSYPQVSYAIPDTRWAPFLGVELYNSIRPADRFQLQQYHVFAGTSFKVDKVHSFRFAYIFQHKVPTNKRLHTLDLEYIITLP